MNGSHTDELLEAFGFFDDNADPTLLGRFGLGAMGNTEGARSTRRRHRITTAVLRETLRRIQREFGDDIPFVLLKGEPLERMLFDERYPRLTGDVDLLVLPGDIEEAQRGLCRLGFERKRNEPPRMWAHNQEPWIHSDHGIIVELHWSLASPGVPQPTPAQLFDSRVSHRLDDHLKVDVLNSRMLLVHLALHFHHHSGFAKGLLDIAGWCDRFEDSFEPSAIHGQFRDLGLFGVLQWPLHTLAKLTNRKSRLWSGDADPVVRIWSEASSRAMRNCLVEAPTGDLAKSLVSVMPEVGPWRGVPLQAMTMALFDEVDQKACGIFRPFVLGPHRIGRLVAGILQ